MDEKTSKLLERLRAWAEKTVVGDPHYRYMASYTDAFCGFESAQSEVFDLIEEFEKEHEETK